MFQPWEDLAVNFIMESYRRLPYGRRLEVRNMINWDMWVHRTESQSDTPLYDSIQKRKKSLENQH